MIVLLKETSEKIEVFARICDPKDTNINVFFMLTLGWTDGYSFIPVGFSTLSLANKSNRYQGIFDNIGHRTNGFKARKDSVITLVTKHTLLVTTRIGSPAKTFFV